MPILPMVKADAYGAGAVEVARALEPLDPWGYGIATVAEGEELREAGIRRRLLIMTPIVEEEFVGAMRARLTPMLDGVRRIDSWGVLGGGAWHLGIDTGMSRAGVRWSDIGALREVVARWPPEGAFTHFHSAERGDGSAEEQERRFEEALRALPARPKLLHAENSPSIVRRGRSKWSLVRPGVFLYGVTTGMGARVRAEPVVSLRARVVDMRVIDEGESVSYEATYRATGRRRVATVAVGYGDGYRRALGNVGQAIVNGHLVPILGNVTMDMIMLDATGIPCEVGDVATVIGRDGQRLIEVEDVARAGKISPYEILTSLRGRLPRFYVTSRSSQIPEPPRAATRKARP